MSTRSGGLSAIPGRIWAGAAILVAIAAIAAVVLYLTLPSSTASFLLIAGIIVSVCGAGPVLLGAYSRRKALEYERRTYESAEVVDEPGKGDQVGRS